MISVIVPNYNHAPYLRQRIESILCQTYNDLELILLDDCSTDSSREIMETYRSNPRVTHIIYNETNGGIPFRQWDKGIEMARGEWVWVAESDDYCEPTFLQCLMDAAADVPDCTLAYTTTWWVSEEGNRLYHNGIGGDTTVYSSHDFIQHKMSCANGIANVSECLFRRSAYRPGETSRYEHMRLCGDWYFYVLLAEKGRVIEVNTPLNYYRQHAANVSNSAESQGLTFLEGIEVLDYMKAHCGLTRDGYAAGWGRLWATYERQYAYPPAVRKAVRRRIAGKYPEIYAYYLIFKAKHLLKKN
ncbi:MAG: glycosyltransferase [Bacteroidales bacterium]|nr:glycosyltransferase [Bacteroidales bacterium]